MRILVLGGDGMLGHCLLRQFVPWHETKVTLRQPLDRYRRFRLFDRDNAYDEVDVLDPSSVIKVFSDFKPQAVVNAVGIIKHRSDSKDGVLSMEVNALFPHLLSRLCREHGSRLVHLSTDCVFSGKKGNYSEKDHPDPEDVYGLSKLLGEADGPGILTLRTSMIGPELQRKTGLVEWFLAQKEKTIRGWRKSIFSGFTTFELARLIEQLVTQRADAYGIYHASSTPISKFDLLTRLDKRLGTRMNIVPDDSIQLDRSLNSSRFCDTFGYAPPAWDIMLDELATEILKLKGSS
jgi:dTDP-4-dehydrorhamnose reductase